VIVVLSFQDYFFKTYERAFLQLFSTTAAGYRNTNWEAQTIPV